MYKKFLIIASKKDKAGIGITTALSQFRPNPLASAIQKDSKNFDFYLREEDIIDDTNLDLEKINKISKRKVSAYSPKKVTPKKSAKKKVVRSKSKKRKK